MTGRPCACSDFALESTFSVADSAMAEIFFESVGGVLTLEGYRLPPKAEGGDEAREDSRVSPEYAHGAIGNRILR